MKILNTTELSTNSTDTIKDGVDGVSDSLDTATQKANEFGEAMSNAGRTQVMSPLTSEDIKSGDYEVEGETTKVVLNKDSESNLIDTTASYKGTPIKALYNAASKSYGFYVFDSTSMYVGHDSTHWYELLYKVIGDGTDLQSE